MVWRDIVSYVEDLFHRKDWMLYPRPDGAWTVPGKTVLT